jgi:O-antigen/teichoic acid export membrane protein
MAAEPTPPATGSYTAGLGYGILSFFATGAITVATSIVTARLFGITVIGQFALAAAPAIALWTLSSVREQVALVRELAPLAPLDPRVTGLWCAVFGFSMAFTILISIVAAGIAYVLYNTAIDQPELFVPALACLAGNVFIQNVSANLDSVFSAFVAGRLIFWIRVHEAVLILVFSLVAGLVAPTVWGLVAATYLALITPLVHRALAVRRFMRWRVDRAELRNGLHTLPSMLKWAVKMAPGPILVGIASQTVTWTLGALSTVAAVGAFNRAQMVASRFQQLTMRIVQMLFPTLVARLASGDRRGFDRVLVDTMRYSTALTLMPPAIAGGASVAVMSVFGPGFAQASDALTIVLFNVTLGSLAVIQSYALYAVDRPGLTSWISVARLAVTVAVAIPGTILLGLTGAALGLVAGVATDCLWKQWALRRHLSTPLHELWSARQMLGLLATGGAAFAVSRALTSVIPYPVGLPLILLAGTAAYGLAYSALVGFTPADAQRLRAARRQLTRRRSRRVAVAAKGAPSEL